MSAHATAGQTAGHAPPDHVPHVLPLKVYFGVYFMLLVFTVITVAVSYVDVGQTLNLVIALAVASAKALMVGLIFMHLAFDKKFNVIIFASSILFLALFIGLTMADTETRGRYGQGFIEGDRAVDPAQPFGEGARRSERALMERWNPPAEGATPAPAAPAPAGGQ